MPLLQCGEFLRMIDLALFLFQKTAADKHGCRSSAAVTGAFSHDREEALDCILEIGAVLLTIAIFLTPLPIDVIHRRGTLLECFTFFEPRIHKLPDAVRLILILLGCLRNCRRIIKSLLAEQLVPCIAPVEDGRLALRRSKESLETFILLMFLKMPLERDELQTAGVKSVISDTDGL